MKPVFEEFSEQAQEIAEQAGIIAMTYNHWLLVRIQHIVDTAAATSDH